MKKENVKILVLLNCDNKDVILESDRILFKIIIPNVLKDIDCVNHVCVSHNATILDVKMIHIYSSIIMCDNCDYEIHFTSLNSYNNFELFKEYINDNYEDYDRLVFNDVIRREPIICSIRQIIRRRLPHNYCIKFY